MGFLGVSHLQNSGCDLEGRLPEERRKVRHALYCCCKRSFSIRIHLSSFGIPKTRARSALEVARGMLDNGFDTPDIAHQLIDEAADVLALSLDSQVSVAVLISRL
jgi:hypothetical protein